VQAGWLGAAIAFLLFLGAISASAQEAADLAGTWQGTLQNGSRGRMVLKISRGGKDGAVGGWKGILYSGTESGMGPQGTLIPAIALRGTALKFTVVAIEGRYEGKLKC
jgi:hypothetical protein